MKKIGVIIARFQVPTLHAGHLHLVEEALKQSDTLVVFLGYKVSQPDINNPFSFLIRKAMLIQALTKLGLEDKVTIDLIEDHPISNELWSQDLDTKIKAHAEAFSKTYNDAVEATLFGSRDSFIKSYFGIHKTAEVSDVPAMSGTMMREKVLAQKEEDLNDHHREGIVYGLKHVYPVGMSVVDVVIYKKEHRKIYFLLGRKPRETCLRVVGGFFDVSQDDSLEDAVCREAKEEVGDITLGEPTYLMSKKIDDWRYRNNQHKIISSLFMAEYVSGDPVANDDLEEIRWVDIDDISKLSVTESHQEFLVKAREALKK